MLSHKKTKRTGLGKAYTQAYCIHAQQHILSVVQQLPISSVDDYMSEFSLSPGVKACWGVAPPVHHTHALGV